MSSNAPSTPKTPTASVELPKPPGRSSHFATFMILCPTSFFLGVLFSQLPYDYPLLWTNQPLDTYAKNPFDLVEQHLQLMHGAPPLIPRILHIIVVVGLLGFFIKLFKPTESQKLFDGASLALYMVGIVIYSTNILKGLRQVSSGEYYQPSFNEEHPKYLGRDDGLRVMAASNTILALVLLGVLVLQAGQWYADRKESQDVARYEQERREKRAAGTSTSSKKRN